MKNRVVVQTDLGDDLPLVPGDRVELQQVILNLILNAIEAMSATSEGSRELLITKGKTESDDVLVAVRDSGPGLAPAAARESLQGLPHDQAERPGPGAVDLPLDHRRARRTIVGKRQFASGRGLPIHVAHQSRRFGRPMMRRRAPACSDPRWRLCGRKPWPSLESGKGSNIAAGATHLFSQSLLSRAYRPFMGPTSKVRKGSDLRRSPTRLE